MDGRPRRRGALPGLGLAPWLLELLLLARLLQLAGGQSVTHNGHPILVSLANSAISSSCNVSYPYVPRFKSFTFSYLHKSLEGWQFNKKVDCPPGVGTENKTHTVTCSFILQLPNASATGTCYCSVHWETTQETKTDKGTFILVRDTGYQEPPPGSQKLLLFCFLGLLMALSLLATALLFWKEAPAPGKLLAWKSPHPSAAKASQQPPPDSDDVYTALQRRETEVYSCIESQAGSLPSSQGLHSQEKPRRFEDDSEFNLVYENL